MKPKRILASVLSVALLLQLSPLNIWALDEDLQQTPQVSTVQENINPAPVKDSALLTAAASASTAEKDQDPAATEEPIPTEKPAAEKPIPTEKPDAEEPTPTEEPAAEEPQEPTAAQAVQAMIDALPGEVTNDNAEAVEQALTDIDDAKQSLTDDELARLDFTRYDAAANALSALWGEATTDAVELLDANAAPSQDPTDHYYLIGSVEDLYWFANEVNNKHKTTINARLTANIKVNDKVFNDDGSLISDPKTWTPIGVSYSKAFKGTFDGAGYTISGLYCDMTDRTDIEYVGLFGRINGGTVTNLGVLDSYFAGNSLVGGVCGKNDGGTIEECYNTGNVTGTSSVGGVCGNNYGGTVKGCHNTKAVNGSSTVGGVCGQNAGGGTVEGCHNEGEVTATVTNTDTSAGALVGGVCGKNNNIVNGCYNTGTVTGTGESIGGVCGQNKNTVNGCYNTGDVSGKGSKVGGVCGENTGKVGNCYYLAGTSANAVGNGADGTNCASKTKLQFQNGAVAYQMQADLGETAEQVWGQKLGTDKTPVLSSETDYKVYHPTSGTSPCTGGYSNKSDGTLNHQYENSVCIYCGEPASEEIVDGYYQIATAEQLRQFAEKVNSGNYSINAKLTADIKLNGDNKVLNDDGSLISDPGNLKEWTPIGTFGQPFTGTFDGNGKTIYGLYYNNSGEDDVGLFGGVGEHGKVINVTVKDSYVSGDNTVGGICGWNKGGTLQNCHNAGTVSGNSWVGGVCGQNTGGTLQECYNIGTVSGGGNYIGGVCGDNYNSGTVNGCYSTARNVCGENSATVENCYYLSTKSGTAHSQGGISKTELQFRNGAVACQMQNDLGQNAEPVWGQTIGTNVSPVLAWQTDDYRPVYPTAAGSTCPGYSNKENDKRYHNYVNGVCTYCGQPEIAYTVTIPATVELGNTATIKAEGVALPDDKRLNVKVADTSAFQVALVYGNETVDKCAYTVAIGETPVTPGNTVLTAEGNVAENSVVLQFNKPETTTYSGTYTGTVSFTVSVDDKSAS